MKKLTIHHDFNLGLKFYTIPEFFRNKVMSDFENLNFKDIKDEIRLDRVEIFFGNRIKTENIKQMINLKWIHLGSVGYDSIDLHLINERKILLTNSKGLMTNSIVEHALNYITTFSRGMHYLNKLRHSNDLNRRSFDYYFHKVSNLKNKNILICGFGEVGSKLANVLSCIGMNIFTISKTPKNIFNNYRLKDLTKILPEMSYVVNLLPLNNETFKLFDLNKFKLMNDSYFINLGRGKTVIEKDLIKAIKMGYINSAALDVFEEEPLSNKSDLLKQEKIIITPHVAGLSVNYWNEQLELFNYNLRKFQKNEKTMKNLILQ